MAIKLKAEFNIDLAKQHAFTILLREYHKFPEQRMELIEYKQIHGNWSCVFTTPEFPDISVVVSYNGTQIHVDLNKRIDRDTHTERQI